MTAPQHRTRAGLPVYLLTTDYHKYATAVQRVNTRVATGVTRAVGSMWCAWVFCVIALAGLPQAVQQSFSGGHVSPLPLVQWTAQTFLQLVLLSIILVGQNISQAASDARTAKAFEDEELTLGEVRAMREELRQLHAALAGEP